MWCTALQVDTRPLVALKKDTLQTFLMIKFPRLQDPQSSRTLNHHYSCKSWSVPLSCYNGDLFVSKTWAFLGKGMQSHDHERCIRSLVKRCCRLLCVLAVHVTARTLLKFDCNKFPYIEKKNAFH